MFDDMFDTEEQLLTGHKEGHVQSTWDRQPRNCAHNLNMPDLPRKKGYPMGLKNQGATCYLNSLLQILYHTPEFREMVLSLPLCIQTSDNPSNFVGKSKHNFLLGFQRLFSEMSASDVRAVPTDYLNKSFGWQGAQHQQQQDIQQAMRVIFDTIQRALFETTYKQAVIGLFRGIAKKYKSCLTCSIEEDHQEIFYDLQMIVKGVPSLNAALVAYSSPEVMEEDNKIYCENCQSKQDMFLGSRLHELPAILVVSLNRFDFDYEKLDRVKLTSRFDFTLELDLNPHLPHLQNPDHHNYELYGVLVHRGSAHGGHYISLVRDVLQQSDWNTGLKETIEQQAKIKDQKDKKQSQSTEKKEHAAMDSPNDKDLNYGWYQINDNIVTAVSVDKLADQFQGSGSAYILFYRRKGLSVIKQKLKIPHYFEVPISAANDILKAQRQVYDNQKQHILINIKGEQHKLKTSLAIAEFLQTFVPKGCAIVQESVHNGLPYYPMQFINLDVAYQPTKTLETEQVVHESNWQIYQIGSAQYDLIKNVIGIERLPFELVLLEGESTKRIVCYNDENFLMLRVKIEKDLKIPYEMQVLTLVTPYKQIILTDNTQNDNMPLPKLGITHCGQIIIKTLGNEDEQEVDEKKKETTTLCFLVERDDIVGLKRIYFQKVKTLEELLKFVIASESLKEGKYRFRNLNGNRLYYLDHYEKRIEELQFTEEMIKLRIQRGEIPIKGDISIKIKLQSILLKAESNIGIEKVFDPNTLLTDVKEWACSSVGLDPALHKLYLTDWTGEPIRSLTRQKLTIFQANFSREELICLRDIHSPIGSELVHLQVFQTLTGSSDSVQKQSFHIKIEEFKTVGDLKEQLIAFAQKLNGIRPDCIRLRERKRDYMFGTIWREPLKSMKSVTINSNKIVYQVLQQPENLKDDQIVLILKHRNVERRIYEGAVQLIFEAGRAPTVQSLKEAISYKVAVNEPIKAIKYMNYDFEWIEISKENIEKVSKKKKGNQKGKKEKGNQPAKEKKEQTKPQGNQKVQQVQQVSKEVVKQHKQQKEHIEKEEKKNKNKNKKDQTDKPKAAPGDNANKPKEPKPKKQQESTQKTNEDSQNLRKAPILLKDGDWIGWALESQLQKDDLQTDQDLSLRVIKEKMVYKGKEKGGFKINVDF